MTPYPPSRSNSGSRLRPLYLAPIVTRVATEANAKGRVATLNAVACVALEMFVAGAEHSPWSGAGVDSDAEGRRPGDTRGRSPC